MYVEYGTAVLVNCSLVRMQHPSSSCLFSLNSKAILSDVMIVMPACFKVSFDWSTHLFIFHSKVVPIFKAKMCFLKTTDRFCF